MSMDRLRWLTEVAIPETEGTLGALRNEAQALLCLREAEKTQAGGAEASMAVSKTSDEGPSPSRPASAFDRHLARELPSRRAETFGLIPRAVPHELQDSQRVTGRTLVPIRPRHEQPAPPPRPPKLTPQEIRSVKGLVDKRTYPERQCMKRGCERVFEPTGPRGMYCELHREPQGQRGPVDKRCTCACGCGAKFTQNGRYRVNCDNCTGNPACRKRRERAYFTPNLARAEPVEPQEPPRPQVRTVVSDGVEFESVWSGGEGLTRVGHNSSLSGVK